MLPGQYIQSSKRGLQNWKNGQLWGSSFYIWKSGVDMWDQSSIVQELPLCGSQGGVGKIISKQKFSWYGAELTSHGTFISVHTTVTIRPLHFENCTALYLVHWSTLIHKSRSFSNKKILASKCQILSWKEFVAGGEALLKFLWKNY